MSSENGNQYSQEEFIKSVTQNSFVLSHPSIHSFIKNVIGEDSNLPAPIVGFRSKIDDTFGVVVDVDQVKNLCGEESKGLIDYEVTHQAKVLWEIHQWGNLDIFGQRHMRMIFDTLDSVSKDGKLNDYIKFKTQLLGFKADVNSEAEILMWLFAYKIIQNARPLVRPKLM